MTAPRRLGVAALLTLALGGLIVTACSRFENPGKGTVTDEIDAIASDLGVADDDLAVQGYGVERTGSAERCAGVDDPWTADRSAIVAPNVVTQDVVIETVAARYRDLGARLRLFRDTTGADDVVFLALDTESRIVVKVAVTRDGRASIFLRHSSCPIDDDEQEPNGPYEEVPVPG